MLAGLIIAALVASTYYSSTPVSGCPCAENEANFHLYIHQDAVGPNRNQVGTVITSEPLSFGMMAITDWHVREGSDPASKLVARAEGMQVQCGQNTIRWYASFNLVFEDDSFKGSTLEVRGVWGTTLAVVGGTGQFTLAQGIVSMTTVHNEPNHAVHEIFIRILYRPFEIQKYAGII